MYTLHSAPGNAVKASNPPFQTFKSFNSIPSQPSRRSTIISASSSSSPPNGPLPILKSAAIGLASAAALAGAAIVLVKQTRKFSSPTTSTSSGSGEDDIHHHTHHTATRQNNNSNSKQTENWLLRLATQRRRSPDAELAIIEARRAKEAAIQLQSWDERWNLRQKTLTDLRYLAAYVTIISFLIYLYYILLIDIPISIYMQ